MDWLIYLSKHYYVKTHRVSICNKYEQSCNCEARIEIKRELMKSSSKWNNSIK